MPDRDGPNSDDYTALVQYHYLIQNVMHVTCMLHENSKILNKCSVHVAILKYMHVGYMFHVI